MQTQQPILLGDESGVESTSVRAVRMSWKALVGSAVAACGLASVGYSAGQSSLRGVRVNGATLQVMRSTDDFKHSFDAWADGLTCVKLNIWVSEIVKAGGAGTTTDSLDATEFKKWYKGVDPLLTPGDKVVANGIMTAAIEKACLVTPAPAPQAAAVPVKSSYVEFGHLYSAETAGKPWADIRNIDTMVREVHAPVAASAGVEKLQLWYHQQLSSADRKSFDDNAVVHLNQGEAQ